MLIEYTCEYIDNSGKYICEYIHNSGEVCGRKCRRREGCYEHWRAKKRVLCKVCGESLLLLHREHVKNMLKGIMLCSFMPDNFSKSLT